MLPWLEDSWQNFLHRGQGERMAHALLVGGPPGIGKMQLAQAMCAWLLCEKPADAACGECRSCRLRRGGAHPDLFTVAPEEGKALIRVDAIRELVRSLTLTTSISPRKVALIAPAEAMNLNAANALLKCLEEPPGDTVIVLLSHDPARLPVTIRSRCQAVAVTAPEPRAAINWLLAESGADESATVLAMEAAAGSPLAAQRLLSEDAIATFQSLRSQLGKLLGRPSAASACASELSDVDPQRAWKWLSLNTADAIRARMTGVAPRWLPSARGLDPRRLSRLQRLADRNRLLAATAVRQDLLLQEWLLEWAGQPEDQAGS